MNPHAMDVGSSTGNRTNSAHRDPFLMTSHILEMDFSTMFSEANSDQGHSQDILPRKRVSDTKEQLILKSVMGTGPPSFHFPLYFWFDRSSPRYSPRNDTALTMEKHKAEWEWGMLALWHNFSTSFLVSLCHMQK